ncbi:MAG: DsbE family thiol:disulfide interchange protein [Pseudomonadota bacterium]
MKLWHLLPLAAVLGLMVLLGLGLQLDPRVVPSPLIGKPMPDFSLPTLEGRPALLSAHDLRGRPLLVNFWASWCAGCKVEHPFLMELSRSVEIVGFNYKDAPSAAKDWLAQGGNPYRVSALDALGQAGLDWGVYGVPETFVLDSGGVIVYKQIGPMTPEAWQTIKGLLQ